MKFIQAIMWPEIFAKWKEREATNPGWIECATRVKGWPDWESWRSFTAEQIGAAKREWRLYRFDNPMIEVPSMLLGPYSSWQDGFINKNVATFEGLLNVPGLFNRFSKHAGVLAILKGLPFKTEFIGLIRKDNNKIVCLEGHHRATAITLSKKLNKKIDFSQTAITIVLTEISKEECYIFDEMLTRGTSKNY